VVKATSGREALKFRLHEDGIRREEEHIIRGYSHGAVDYIVKPLNADALVSKVRIFLGQYQGRDHVFELANPRYEHAELAKIRVLAITG